MFYFVFLSNVLTFLTKIYYIMLFFANTFVIHVPTFHFYGVILYAIFCGDFGDSLVIPVSSIGVTLAPFQDGRHGPKMAARTQRWPPRPPATRMTRSGAS